MEIKAVAFDFIGVYASGEERFEQSLQRRYGLSQEQVNHAYKCHPDLKRYKRGEVSGAQFWGRAFREWGVDTSVEDIKRLIADSYVVDEPLVAWIDELRNARMMTALCSNTYQERMDALDERFGFTRQFDAYVPSYAVGVLKPHVRMFECLASELKLSPSQILFFDDKQANIDALLAFDPPFKALLYREAASAKRDYLRITETPKIA